MPTHHIDNWTVLVSTIHTDGSMGRCARYVGTRRTRVFGLGLGLNLGTHHPNNTVQVKASMCQW